MTDYVVKYKIVNYALFSEEFMSKVITRKKKTGKTYKDLLQEKRLSQAAFLLMSTGMNVSDISVLIGYENVSYFHRIFSRRFGCSPKSYRDSHIENE